MWNQIRNACVIVLIGLAGVVSPTADALAGGAGELTVVVMDPLAAPLSCPCVKGYAQRDYDKLGAFLEQELGRPVRVVFSESLEKALEETDGKADLVIGKRSVVSAQARTRKLALEPVLALTGKDGQTIQTGLIVVPAGDPAKSVADLKGYRILFGPEECDEKHSAALTLLEKHGVDAPAKIETCAACSDGATEILELGSKVRAATVISSYAAPLLEGCGTIKKGDLRVVGTTEPVPFVVAFLSGKLSDKERSTITATLKQVGEEPVLLAAIESKSGFVPEKERRVAEGTDATSKKKN
jgi:ABC-type phosphate/phosphonate transport system substrate-binding protein